jgi:PAS domain S-box-containing protein
MPEQPKARILYIEDDRGLARLLQKRLERAGYAVDLAYDGGQGLSQYWEDSYDIVAVDHTMPIYDGLEIIRRLRLQGAAIPIVMVTGSGSEEIAVEAMKLGASDYIVKDADGKYLELIPSVINRVLQRQQLVKEREEALEALKESERKLRSVIEQSQDGIVLTDEQGCIIEWNPAMERITGLAATEVQGKPIWDVQFQLGLEEQQTEEAYQQVRSMITQLLEQGTASWLGQLLERKYLHSSKQRRIVEGTVFPIKTDKGFMLGSILRDVTESKQAALQLAWEASVNAAMAELSRALLHPAPIEEISYLVLEQAKRLTGSVFGFVGHIEPETGNLISSTMTRDVWDTCQVANKDVVFEKFCGLWGWVLDNQQPILVNDPISDPRSTGTPQGHIPIERFLSVPAIVERELVGQIALANPDCDYADRDLSLVERLASLYALAIQRQRAQEALRQYTDELARSNQELEQFAHIASHDLQEPLRMITSFLQLLQQRYRGQFDETADEFISFALEGGQRMQALVRDLLAYSRVGTRGKPLAPTDSEAVLKQTLVGLQIAIEENGATITYDPLPVVMADNIQLGQLFQNLISNAIKFRREAPPVVQIRAEQRDGKWLFSVSDNGIGIEPEQRNRVFLIFQRLHTRQEYPGTGIGLAVCKKIVDRHGGEIWVEASPDQGSIFYFTLAAAE